MEIFLYERQRLKNKIKGKEKKKARGADPRAKRLSFLSHTHDSPSNPTRNYENEFCFSEITQLRDKLLMETGSLKFN